MIELQSVWGWQPALYLFLGGMGAGAFVMAAILYLRRGDKLARTVAVSAWLAVFALVAGLLCLLTELTNPLRGMLLWQSFSNMGSWMTIGAWILVATLVVFGLFAVLVTGPVHRWLENHWAGLAKASPKILRVLAVCGIVLGICVAAYTGILLMSAPGVPFWNTLLLPCLFTVSGLDTGVALVELVAAAQARKEPMEPKDHRLMATFVVALVLLEVVALAALLGSALSAGDPNVSDSSGVAHLSAGLLVTGQLAPWFWGLVVVCGLAAPLVASLLALLRKSGADGEEVHRRGEGVICVGAIGALVGGCALRFLMVMVGLHADPVAGTMANLFQQLLGRL